ncbi:16S rRNA (cytosine(967)-C(5))-methyltransferase RsmB [Alkaliphilus sp. MSJ-5]|uniref:16S rRNA (cytosine(967)-C(5))-methyltransferase n=1 Tax=Alkaliphilus flagellatus TaxID=2841507 RepID=A0ABS6G4G0_9FIRM|nr:16S rRNA (cytosine(967)-C(5))-methyltransferase RsmB [Alkaliphilus flagellatus]MBU5677362.1 16S rRNA (cytosine(967)-C(5))-methyltransferase RsmB [Alkaliphilus flagellatus]
MNPREGALITLYEINEKEAFSNIALNKELRRNSYNQLDKNLLTELVYGALENQIYIDYIIGQFSTFAIKQMNPYTLNLLRLGIYQLLFLNKVPSFAAVNETVNLSKKYCKKTTGFINGVLRNVQRNMKNIKLPNPEENIVKYLSVKYSHPEWLVKTFLNNFDKDFAEELLKANNTKPELYFRINTLKISIDDCIRLLTDEGYTVKQSSLIKEAVVVKGLQNIEQSNLYKKGYIQIQDFSSMLVAKILDPKEGEYVIDVCSAPGGKTTHMAQIMNNKGTIIARDIHEHKLKLVERNAQRLGIKIINTENFSGNNLDEKLLNMADKVLVDAPCSGLGIIRRKPEIKYRKQDEDIKSITAMQYDILKNAAKYVKIGGELVYSTCTINTRENEDIVQKFLKDNPNYVLININEEYKDFLPGEHNNGTVQLYPNLHNTDGFFISKIKRIK